jgi:hypothetical protein
MADPPIAITTVEYGGLRATYEHFNVELLGHGRWQCAQAVECVARRAARPANAAVYREAGPSDATAVPRPTVTK